MDQFSENYNIFDKDRLSHVVTDFKKINFDSVKSTPKRRELKSSNLLEEGINKVSLQIAQAVAQSPAGQ